MWVFLASSLLPVMLVACLVYWQLDSLAQERRQADTAEAAKAEGLSIVAQLISAAGEFERNDGRIPADSLLLGAVREPVPQPILNREQLHFLDSGKPVIWWNAHGTRPVQFVVLRRDPGTRDLQMARLRELQVFSFDASARGVSKYAIVDDAGHVLLATADYPDDWQREGSEWRGASWQMFLASTFAAPTLSVIEVEPATGGLDEYGTLAAMLLLALLAVLVAALWMAAAQIRRLMGPLSDLSAATRELADFRLPSRVEVHGSDELAELGTSFNAMADRLQQQMATLESMADIDRLLLEAPELEAVLDALLPRIARLTDVPAVSVLLRDADDPGNVRVFDYRVGDPVAQPVRRAILSPAGLGDALVCRISPVELADNRALAQLLPATSAACCLYALRAAGDTAGWLCLAGDRVPVDSQADRVPLEFAARLSVALTNLRHAAALNYQANYDSLTGLPNRAMFREQLAAAIASADRNGEPLGLLYIDLDDFKQVNDSAGHGAGDLLLRSASARLAAICQHGQLLARLGGDEFAVIVPRPPEPERLAVIAGHLLDSLHAPLQTEQGGFHVRASIGIAVYPGDGAGSEELLRAADIAMYRAKEVARGEAVFFAPEYGRRVQARLDTETRMRRGLGEGWFELWYQPIVQRGRVRSVEGLLRWSGPGVPLDPAQMIPVAELSGLIIELGVWVLRAACQQMAYWQQREIAPEYVSVNASVLQLRRSDFAAHVRATLAEHELQPRQLQIEVTESVAADRDALLTVRELAQAGVRLAIDDFGTGYSSLGQLQQLPFDAIKIDQCFVRDLPHNANSIHLCRTIITLSNGLQKSVIAEGVETDEQARCLQGLGCELLQGFRFGRPMNATAISALLAEEHKAELPCWNSLAG